MIPPLLQIEHLNVVGQTPQGDWVQTVRDVSVEVRPGEVVALIGGSGAGKTTVALASLGYTRPGTRVTGGRVRLDEVDILQLSRGERQAMRGRQIAYVAQSAQAALNPAIPIGQQVAEPLILHGLADPAVARRMAIQMMACLDLPNPSELAERYPHQASGGQQQRIIAAMALIGEPRLLVLDEPTTALDVTTQIEVLKAIKAIIRDRGSAGLYVTHDLAVVAQVADRIVVMKDGAVVEQASTADIIERPSTPYARRLVSAVRHHAPSEIKLREEARNAKPLVEVDRACCSYGQPGLFRPVRPEDDILREVSFDIGAREVVAVVGESGSGKSTLARMVAGLHPARAGSVRFRGRPLASVSGRRDLEELRRIQIIFQSQDLSLNPEQQVETAIGRPLQLYFGLNGAARAARVAELLEMVGLPEDYAGRFPNELSGGERQRVSIARAFAARPSLVLCDEILSALDTLVATQILDLMRRLLAENDVAYLFISHDLATVATIADRVVVLYGGRVCEIGPTASVFSPPHHPYTALLLSSVPLLRQGWLEEVLRRQPLNQAQSGIQLSRDEGCIFRTRCSLAMPGLCDRLRPPAVRMSSDRVIFCHQTGDALLEAQHGTAKLGGDIRSAPGAKVSL